MRPLRSPHLPSFDLCDRHHREANSLCTTQAPSCDLWVKRGEGKGFGDGRPNISYIQMYKVLHQCFSMFLPTSRSLPSSCHLHMHHMPPRPPDHSTFPHNISIPAPATLLNHYVTFPSCTSVVRVTTVRDTMAGPKHGGVALPCSMAARIVGMSRLWIASLSFSRASESRRVRKLRVIDHAWY